MNDFVFTAADFSLLLGIVGSIIGIYSRFKTNILQNEQRITVLEMQVKHLEEFKLQSTKRMDRHDKQTEVLIQLTSNIEHLTEKVDDLKQRMEEMHEGKS